MKIIKKLLALSFCLLTLISLTACHNAKPLSAYEVPENFDTSKHYEITFWAKNDSNNTQKKIYKQAIEDFQALYPNITVIMRSYSNYNDIFDDVITNISTSTTPNVCITYPDHIATYLSGENVVVPLDKFFDSEKYGLGGSEVRFESTLRSEMIEKFLDEGKFGGFYYALPFMRSTEALYINKTLVEKLGYTIPDVLTWDYVFEIAEAATAKNSDGTYVLNGQKTMIPFIYKSTDNMMIQMLKQRNAGYSDANANILIFNDTTREIMKTAAAHAKTGAFNIFAIASYPGNYLNAGQCLFAVDSTAGSTWIGADAPLVDIPEDQLVDFETVVRPVPQYDVENPQMISQGPSLCIFNKEDQDEVLASWLFAQYLLTNKVQIAYAETEGYVPVTSKAQQSAEYQDYLSKRGQDNDLYYSVKIDATKLLLEYTDSTFTTAVFNGSTSLRNAAGQLIEDAVTGTIRKKNVNDEYIDNDFEKIASLYHLNEISASGNSKREFGALPAGSRILLITLAVLWLGIIAYVVKERLRSRKKLKTND